MWDDRRGPADLVMALALIHHLAIANNVPLRDAAAFFAELAKYLIIEFVPRSDSQVKRLLSTRQDIFPEYSVAGFEAAFGKQYKIIEKQAVEASERVVYLMQRS